MPLILFFEDKFDGKKMTLQDQFNVTYTLEDLFDVCMNRGPI